MVRMTKVDPKELQGKYAPTKWQEIIEQFEREGYQAAKIEEGERKGIYLQSCLGQAIKRCKKNSIMKTRIINGECYLLRKELLENGR